MPYRLALTPMDSRSRRLPQSLWSVATLGPTSLVLQIYTDSDRKNVAPRTLFGENREEISEDDQAMAPGVILCLSYSTAIRSRKEHTSRCQVSTTSKLCINEPQVNSTPPTRFPFRISSTPNTPIFETQRAAPTVHTFSPDISYFLQPAPASFGTPSARTMTVQIRTPGSTSSLPSDHSALFIPSTSCNYPAVTTRTFHITDSPSAPPLLKKRCRDDYDDENEQINDREMKFRRNGSSNLSLFSWMLSSFKGKRPQKKRRIS